MTLQGWWKHLNWLNIWETSYHISLTDGICPLNPHGYPKGMTNEKYQRKHMTLLQLFLSTISLFVAEKQNNNYIHEAQSRLCPWLCRVFTLYF